jgi:hypothetical protein
MFHWRNVFPEVKDVEEKCKDLSVEAACSGCGDLTELFLTISTTRDTDWLDSTSLCLLFRGSSYQFEWEELALSPRKKQENPLISDRSSSPLASSPPSPHNSDNDQWPVFRQFKQAFEQAKANPNLVFEEDFRLDDITQAENRYILVDITTASPPCKRHQRF